MSTSTAIAARPQQAVAQRQSPADNLRRLLESRKDEIARVLPKHLDADRLVKIATVAVHGNQRLLDCSPASVLRSVMTAAQLGLDVGGALGSAYLVPFKVDGSYECQLIIGYRGLIDLARRSGQIVSIEANVVYANDEFDIERGTEGTKLRHKPALDKEPGPFRLVYAIAKLRDGGTQVETMTKAQVDAIKVRALARSGGKGPWITDYDEMGRKTVVKRLCKYLPISVELADAVSADNVTDFGSDDIGEATSVAQGAAALNARLADPGPAQQLPGPAPTDDAVDARPPRLTDVVYAADSPEAATFGTAEAHGYELLTGDAGGVEPAVAKEAVARSRESIAGFKAATAGGREVRAAWLNAIADLRLDLNTGNVVDLSAE